MLKIQHDHKLREFIRETHETYARSFSCIVYIMNIRGLFVSPSLLSVSFAWKEPLNARGESSVVVYLHNLWGSKNAKKLISRPRHRPSPSLRLPASSLVYTCFIPHSSPFTTSTTSSSFARVCPRPFRPGLLRSLGALSQLFPEVRINFYFVLWRPQPLPRRPLSISLSLFDFFLRRPWRRRPVATL